MQLSPFFRPVERACPKPGFVGLGLLFLILIAARIQNETGANHVGSNIATHDSAGYQNTVVFNALTSLAENAGLSHALGQTESGLRTAKLDHAILTTAPLTNFW